MLDRLKSRFKERTSVKCAINSFTPWDQDTPTFNEQESIPTHRRKIVQDFLSRVIDQKSLKNRLQKIKTQPEIREISPSGTQAKKYLKTVNHHLYLKKHSIQFPSSKRFKQIDQEQIANQEEVQDLKDIPKQFSLYPQSYQNPPFTSSFQETLLKKSYQKHKSYSAPKQFAANIGPFLEEATKTKINRSNKLTYKTEQIRQIFTNYKYTGRPVLKHLRHTEPRKSSYHLPKNRAFNHGNLQPFFRKMINMSCIDKTESKPSEYSMKIAQATKRHSKFKYTIYHDS